MSAIQCFKKSQLRISKSYLGLAHFELAIYQLVVAIAISRNYDLLSREYVLRFSQLRLTYDIT